MVADLNSKVAFQNVNTHCTAQLSSPSLLKERGGVREEEEGGGGRGEGGGNGIEKKEPTLC